MISVLSLSSCCLLITLLRNHLVNLLLTLSLVPSLALVYPARLEPLRQSERQQSMSHLRERLGRLYSVAETR